MPNTVCPSCQTQCRRDLDLCAHCREKLPRPERDGRIFPGAVLASVLILMYLAFALVNRAHYGYSFVKSFIIYLARVFFW